MNIVGLLAICRGRLQELCIASIKIMFLIEAGTRFLMKVRSPKNNFKK